MHCPQDEICVRQLIKGNIAYTDIDRCKKNNQRKGYINENKVHSIEGLSRKNEEEKHKENNLKYDKFNKYNKYYTQKKDAKQKNSLARHYSTPTFVIKNKESPGKILEKENDDLNHTPSRNMLFLNNKEERLGKLQKDVDIDYNIINNQISNQTPRFQSTQKIKRLIDYHNFLNKLNNSYSKQRIEEFEADNIEQMNIANLFKNQSAELKSKKYNSRLMEPVITEEDYRNYYNYQENQKQNQEIYQKPIDTPINSRYCDYDEMPNNQPNIKENNQRIENYYQTPKYVENYHNMPKPPEENSLANSSPFILNKNVSKQYHESLLRKDTKNEYLLNKLRNSSSSDNIIKYPKTFSLRKSTDYFNQVDSYKQEIQKKYKESLDNQIKIKKEYKISLDLYPNNFINMSNEKHYKRTIPKDIPVKPYSNQPDELGQSALFYENPILNPISSYKSKHHSYVNGNSRAPLGVISTFANVGSNIMKQPVNGIFSE